MLTLYSYPDLFGLPDNNPYGLKIFAFLKLCGVPFRHEHIFDASHAPRGQLPYITDDDETIGDSDAIVAHVIRKYAVPIDNQLTASQRDTHLLIRRTLDDLYWVMSFSRWKDDRFWPLFCGALLRTHSVLTPQDLQKAREYNALRYHYQGIGRFEPDAAYARGIADLTAIAHLLPETGFLFGPKPTSIDAAIYGFIANVYFYDIDTPLKQHLLSQPNIVAHCQSVHAVVRT